MNKFKKYGWWFMIIGLISSQALLSQSTETKKSRIQLEYIQDVDGVQRIVATLKVREDRYLPFPDVSLKFYNHRDTSRILLDEIKTNKLGVAEYLLAEENRVYTDTTGLMSFEVSFEGNEEARSTSRKIEIIPVNMKISFLQEDSIKYIAIEVQELGVQNEQIPIADQEILFYIKGTFSLLEIGRSETDASGNTMIEFPVEMPGDTMGVVAVISQIGESDYYGNVQAGGKINWAKVVPLKAEKHRGLGDTDAPLWMVYTLIILLSAVWFHYFYVIYLIVRIKLARNSLISS